mgnify:CR=1 FL=1
MTKKITIALDAMGGDNAPEVVLRGADIARQQSPNINYILYGNNSNLDNILNSFPELRSCSKVHHTSEIIAANDKPSLALRKGRKSSMGLAIESVNKGESDGVVSAGNTGALMVISRFLLKTLSGIDRPAIATFVPTQKGQSLMLDLGANVECDSDNLVQFAVMGEVFVRTVMQLKQPSIGLLNVGSEEAKGNDSVRTASDILKNIDLPIKFNGFIEGNDIFAGAVDVVVTDGFSGNIALKTAEGMVTLYSEFLRSAFKSSLLSKLGFFISKRALRGLKSKLDPRVYNGAILLGLNGIVVKSHGSTDPVGFANAIGVAVDMVTNNFNDNIKKEFDNLCFQDKKN